MSAEAIRHLPATPMSPRAARRFVEVHLEGCATDASQHLAVLLTCELVTNALLHARSEVLVRVRCEADVIRVEVADDDPTAPPPPDLRIDDDATTGRGLLLVQELSERWGVQPHSDGKTIWFELPAG